MRVIWMIMMLAMLITATIVSVNAKNGSSDVDGDGIPDALDVDADGDGMPNIHEAVVGTDPLDARDFVFIERIEVAISGDGAMTPGLPLPANASDVVVVE